MLDTDDPITNWMFEPGHGWVVRKDAPPICWHETFVDGVRVSAWETKWLFLSSYLKCKLCKEERDNK